VPRRIFEARREAVTGGRRKVHSEGLHNLYFTPNFIGVMKSSRKRWADHMVHVRDKESAYVIKSENLRGRSHPEEIV
jgi:hypothetical protein